MPPTSTAPASFQAGTADLKLVAETNSDTEIPPSDALSDNPPLLSGTELAVTGKADRLLTDAAGRRAGVTDPAADVEHQDIPGSTYQANADFASAFLTEGRAAGRWTATADGPVRMWLRHYADDRIVSTTPYPAVIVRTGAVQPSPEHAGMIGRYPTHPTARRLGSQPPSGLTSKERPARFMEGWFSGPELLLVLTVLLIAIALRSTTPSHPAIVALGTLQLAQDVLAAAGRRCRSLRCWA